MTDASSPEFIRSRQLVETVMKEVKGDRAAACAVLTYAQALIFAVVFYNGEAGMTKEEWADEIAKIHLQAFIDIKPSGMGSQLN